MQVNSQEVARCIFRYIKSSAPTEPTPLQQLLIPMQNNILHSSSKVSEKEDSQGLARVSWGPLFEGLFLQAAHEYKRKDKESKNARVAVFNNLECFRRVMF